MKKLLDKYRKLPVQLKASFWFLVCSFLQKGITSLSTIIFTRLLTTAEYGQYTHFSSWLNIVTVFVCLRLSYGVYAQGLVKFEEDRKHFSSSMQGLTLTLCLCWTVVYLLFHNFFNGLLQLTTVQMLCMLVMIWSTAVFNLWAQEQRVSYRYKAMVIITLIVSLAKPGLGVLMVLNAQDKVTARVFGLALAELIGYVALFFIQMYRGKQFYSKKYWKYSLMFNLPLIPHYLSQTILSSSDRIMIKMMIGDSQAGIYGLAYSVSQIMTLFNQALENTIQPWMYQKIKRLQSQDIGQMVYICLIFIATVNILMIAFAPEIVFIFAPQKYFEAIYVIPPVAMSCYFMFAYNMFARFEFYYEKTKYIMVSSVAAALINVGLNYLLMPVFGYMVAGYTTLICYMSYCMFHYCFMKKICREDMGGVQVYDEKVLLTITICFLILGFSFLFVYDHMIIRYGMIVAIMLVGWLKRSFIMSKAKELMVIRKNRKPKAQQ